MKSFKRRFYMLAFIFICGGHAFCQEYHESIDMRVPFPPAVIPINGKPTVYYELYLTNFSSDSIVIGKMDVTDPADTAIIASLTKDELSSRIAMIGAPKKQGNILSPGNSCVIYIEFVCQWTKTPLRLEESLSISNSNDRKTFTVRGGSVQLSQESPIVLGSPLKGGPWAAIYDPTWQRGHRRVIYTVDGKARIPGRYAIDFIRLDTLGRYANGNEDQINNWYGYGADVLAVSNGTIVAASDVFPESNTLSGHPACPPAKAAGNYIAIDMGNNRIAFYEHLRPGSIRVKSGQRIKKGEVIASLGFTGQTQGPHLHFHVADRNSTLGAEGIPFVFEKFTSLGGYTDFGKFGKEPWTGSKAIPVSAERPAPGSVIVF